MSIKKLTINGLRGFASKTNINFALPDKQNPGSGLTVMVGPNNSGKSTVIEAIHLLSSNTDVVSLPSRNVKTKGDLQITAEDTIGNVYTLKSTKNKGAFVEKKYNGINEEYWNNKLNTFILSSKRGFSSTFNNNNYQNREFYKGNIGDSDYRSENNINNNFGGRLLTIYKNRKKFDNCLEKILSPLPNWTIESSTGNNLYLEFTFDDIKHSSKGAGDGYINIFNIIDSLYDSSENNVILIDEPEISLHPDLQRKLFSLLVEYSKDKQIIVSTHSPYFVDWNLFSRKSKILRLKKVNNDIKIFELTDKSREGIKKIINDAHHPHILSLDANEIFFLNDNIILTEGQDDVLCYREIFKKYEYKSKASFFGWGAGGASKMEFILNILSDLGYEKVFTILDNDKRDTIKNFKKMYPQYEFYAIIADDVRNKERNKNIDKIIEKINDFKIEDEEKEKIINFINAKFKNVKGLVVDMSTYDINSEYNDDIINLIEKIKRYFETDRQIVIDKYNDELVIENNKMEDKLFARQLLDKWISKNKLFEYVQKKYKKFEFHAGDGGELSFKKTKEHTYYVIIEQIDYMSENYSITINYHIIINTLKNRVKLKKKKVISNTLPICKIRKAMEKLFN